MKYIISFALIISSKVVANPINFYFEGKTSEAKIYKRILIKDYQIPKELISLIKVKKCEEEKTRGKMDLCIKNNGDLYWVSVDDEFVKESLKVFQSR